MEVNLATGLNMDFKKIKKQRTMETILGVIV
jgi:hypothetical protein